MTSLWPGGDCDPCERGLHEKCLGWTDRGFCGCSSELCLLRLITRVMWEIHRPSNNHQGDE